MTGSLHKTICGPMKMNFTLAEHWVAGAKSAGGGKRSIGSPVCSPDFLDGLPSALNGFREIRIMTNTRFKGVNLSSGLSTIKNVILMMGNRSFDHLVGYLTRLDVGFPSMFKPCLNLFPITRPPATSRRRLKD
jgi:hypothetical protein